MDLKGPTRRNQTKRGDFMSNQYIYQLGVTQITLGATPQLVKFGANVNGFRLNANSSMVITNEIVGAVLANGVEVTSSLDIHGPAQFYLAGAGTADFIVFHSANDSIY